MSPKAPIRFFCWKVGCGCIHCLNIGLAFIALIQTGLVLLNNVQKEMPLPEGMTRWLVQIGTGKDLHATWSRAVFDLRGGFYLEDLSLRNPNTTEYYLEAGTISINFAPLHLVFGLFPPVDEVLANDIRIYTPARYSPTGLNEPVIEIKHAHLHEQDGKLVIEDMLAASGGLRVIFSGEGPLRFPRPQGDGSGGRANRIPALLGEILRLPADLDADCRIHWKWTEQGQHEFAVFALSDTLSLPRLTLKTLVADAQVTSDGTSLTVEKLAFDAQLASIGPGKPAELLPALPLELPVAVSLYADGSPAPVSWGSVPSQVSVLIRDPFDERIPIDLFHLETSLSSETRDYHWSASGEGFFAEGTASPFPTPPDSSWEPDFPFSISFRAYLDNPYLGNFFPQLPDHRLIRDAHAQFIRFAGQTTPDNRLKGSFVSDHLYIGETEFAHIHSSIDLSRTDLNLARINVQKTASQSATGSYFHHFPSFRFSLNARGAIYPQSLDNLLGRWWKRIFTHIHAKVPLSGDVTVWGFWNNERSLRSVTAVEGGGASYRGIEVPELRVRVRSNGNWSYLDDLEARFGSQRVTGKIAWQQGLPDDVRRPILIRFSSDAPWEIVQQASGVKALGQLELSGNPEVSVHGTLWQRPRNADPETRMIPQLRLQLNNPNESFKVSGLDLENMRFEGTLLRDNLSLRSVSGVLSEGVFTGRVSIRNWEDPELQERHLQIQLFDADYAGAIHQVSGLLEDPEVVRESLLRKGMGGRVDADIDLLLGSNLAACRGEGRITLRNGRIGEIHVFGGLSRTLSTMGLGFSTLDLNAASLQWKLKDSVIAIPQCAITGPVLNMRMAGKLDLENDLLSLKAEAYFFGGLMSKVLTPVSDNFLFDVTGTLSNPRWQLRLNPFRWFQNRLGSGSGIESAVPASP